jgi:hypothetical protein
MAILNFLLQIIADFASFTNYDDGCFLSCKDYGETRVLVKITFYKPSGG